MDLRVHLAKRLQADLYQDLAETRPADFSLYLHRAADIYAEIGMAGSAKWCRDREARLVSFNGKF